jgi:hypothetical protein
MEDMVVSSAGRHAWLARMAGSGDMTTHTLHQSAAALLACIDTKLLGKYGTDSIEATHQPGLADTFSPSRRRRHGHGAVLPRA